MSTEPNAITLDQQYIRENLMQSREEAENFLSLIDLFQTNTEELMEKLLSAATSNDREEIRAAAHRMKGTASTMGAKHLAELFAWISNSFVKMEVTPQDFVERVHAELEVYTSKARTLIAQHLAENAS